MQKPPKQAIHGWLNLHKPLHISSTQAVGAVKRILRPMKIGHAGTLDPLASGVLPLALGDATKTVSYMMDAVKSYEFTITFGARTATDDMEGEVIATSDVRPTFAQIEAVLSQFVGNISQLPPIYSALKVDGERAYALARAGEAVTLHPRQVRVDGLEIVTRDAFTAATAAARSEGGYGGGETAPQSISLRVTCGKGTYVRSLARDIAHALGTEGHVSRLIRTQVGVFHLSEAISLDFLEKTVHKAGAQEGETLKAWLKPVNTVLDDIPACEVDGQRVAKLRTGQSVACDDALNGMVAVMHNGKLVALAHASEQVLTPKRVFNI